MKQSCTSTINEVENIMTNISHPSPTCIARIGNACHQVPIQALIDTGANISIICPEAYESIRTTSPLITSDHVPLLDEIKLSTANGSRMEFQGLAMVDVNLGKIKIPGCFLLVGQESRSELPEPLIIGMNVIRHMPGLNALLSATRETTRGKASAKRLKKHKK